MNLSKGPCYKCQNRTATCHADCELYEEYSRQRAEYNAKVYRKKVIDYAFADKLHKEHEKVRKEHKRAYHEY